MKKVRKSLGAFGQVRPLLVAPGGEIIDNELVWLALKADGATHVDVIVVADKSPAELKALRLTLNRTALDARWDEQNLRGVLEQLVDVDFDLELTGFDAPEIDHYLNLDAPQANVEENGSDIPPVGVSAVSTPGIIWSLGDHRVGCGNATDLAFVSRVLNGRAANVCFVDAPYNIKVDGFITGKGRHRHREFIQGAGELSTDEYFALLRDSLLVLKRNCTPAALIYSCIDWRHVMEMTVAGRACDMPLYTICVWTKTNGGMGGIYRNAHELVCVFRAGAEHPLDNVELGRHGRNRTNVWSYPGMSSFGKERDKLLGSHPTVKPVTMISDVLRDVTKRGDVVLDTFLGSGSTLMAAQETGRVCCGVELDPLYVDVTIHRWQNATGRDAVMAETGERFNDVAQRLLAAPSEANDGS
ncbi:DNA modification methylase [Bradyrhizobium erythrophlei]|nr:DNA modification methylase [Bradyrhizobium erythrophlei]